MSGVASIITSHDKVFEQFSQQGADASQVTEH